MSLPTNSETIFVPEGLIRSTRRLTVGQALKLVTTAFPDVSGVLEDFRECDSVDSDDEMTPFQEYTSHVNSVAKWCEKEDLDPVNKAEVIKTTSIIFAYRGQCQSYTKMLAFLFDTVYVLMDKLTNIKTEYEDYKEYTSKRIAELENTPGVESESTPESTPEAESESIPEVESESIPEAESESIPEAESEDE